MSYAFISTQEDIFSNEGAYLGARVVEVRAEKIFVETDDLFWVACAPDLAPENSYFDMNARTIKPIPQPVATQPQPQTTGTQPL